MAGGPTKGASSYNNTAVYNKGVLARRFAYWFSVEQSSSAERAQTPRSVPASRQIHEKPKEAPSKTVNFRKRNEP